MSAPPTDKLAIELHHVVSTAKDRIAALQRVAELLKGSGSYRWVGLYDVDHEAGTVPTSSGADRVLHNTQSFPSPRD